AVAFVVLGTAAGSGMTAANIAEFRRSLPYVLAGVGMLLATTALCAWAVWALGVTGGVDSYLATAPGASELGCGVVAERGGGARGAGGAAASRAASIRTAPPRPARASSSSASSPSGGGRA